MCSLRNLIQHLGIRFSRANDRPDIRFLMNQHMREDGTRLGEQPADGGTDVRAILHAKRRDAHGFRDAPEIWIVGEIHMPSARLSKSTILMGKS
jgi:hypothetical protein